MLLAIGCRLEIRCPAATPLLALVHPHISLLPELRSPERVRLEPDRTYELLSDAAGNRWSRLIASAGVTTFTYEARIERPDSTDPVIATATACAVQALPVDTYPLLNPSPYCDTAALMTFAWNTFTTECTSTSVGLRPHLPCLAPPLRPHWAGFCCSHFSSHHGASNPGQKGFLNRLLHLEAPAGFIGLVHRQESCCPEIAPGDPKHGLSFSAGHPAPFLPDGLERHMAEPELPEHLKPVDSQALRAFSMVCCT